MSASVPMRESKPASGEKQKGKASPPSSAILSGYTNSTEQIRAGDDNHQISSVQNMFPKSGTRRNQQLSPLVKETLSGIVLHCGYSV